MKKIFCWLLAVGLITIFLTGCSQKEEAMIVKPTTFTEETTEVLSLFDDEIAFYDIVVNDSVEAVSFDVWVYEDDVWVNYGKTQSVVSNLNSKLAIKITDNSFSLYTIDDNGHTKYTTPNLDVNFTETSMQVFGWERNAVDIELNKEILIYSKYGTNENTFSTNDSDFRSVVCDKGVAITITFLGEMLE